MNKDELPELPPKLLQDFHHFEQACRYESQRAVGEMKESLFDQMREYALAAIQTAQERAAAWEEKFNAQCAVADALSWELFSHRQSNKGESDA